MDRQTLVATARDLEDSTQTGNLYRSVAVCSGTISHLAEGVVSPGPSRTVSPDGQAVRCASADREDLGKSRNLHGRGPVDSWCRRPIRHKCCSPKTRPSHPPGGQDCDWNRLLWPPRRISQGPGRGRFVGWSYHLPIGRNNCIPSSRPIHPLEAPSYAKLRPPPTRCRPVRQPVQVSTAGSGCHFRADRKNSGPQTCTVPFHFTVKLWDAPPAKARTPVSPET